MRSRKEELQRAYRGFPREVLAAIDAGVDVSLLVETLALTPSERLEQLQSVVTFHEALQNATGHRHDAVR